MPNENNKYIEMFDTAEQKQFNMGTYFLNDIYPAVVEEINKSDANNLDLLTKTEELLKSYLAFVQYVKDNHTSKVSPEIMQLLDNIKNAISNKSRVLRLAVNSKADTVNPILYQNQDLGLVTVGEDRSKHVDRLKNVLKKAEFLKIIQQLPTINKTIASQNSTERLNDKHKKLASLSLLSPINHGVPLPQQPSGTVDKLGTHSNPEDTTITTVQEYLKKHRLNIRRFT